jgi:phosphoserine phosphatase RsbU/P
MASERPQASRYRPLLLALAILFAAATVTYSVCWMYYIRATIDVEVGMDTQAVASGVEVKDVWSGTPAESAGLRAQDVMISINGEPVAGQSGVNTLNRIWYRARAGEVVHLTVRRVGEAQPMVISPVFRPMKGAGDTGSLARRGAAAIIGFYPLLFLVVGLAVLFLRVEDRYAWLLAMVFAGLIAQAPIPWAITLAPAPLQYLSYWYVGIVDPLLPGLFYFFFSVFPVRSPIDRKLPWLKWVLVVVGAVLGWGGVATGELKALPILSAGFSQHAIGLTRLIVSYGTVILGMVSLLLNALSVTNVDDRRKLKVMLWGTLVSVIPAILIGMPYDLWRAEKPFWLEFARAVFLFILPLSFAYAVVKHRVMDIPVLLRRSARYLLVERGFAILILIISVGLTLWFGQAFARRFAGGTRAAIPIGATFGILLITGATQVHRHVRTRLDRAFFRTAYDAQQILETLAATTLTVMDREALAELLHRQIQEALHPMPLFIYLVSRQQRLHAYAGNPPEETVDLPSRGPRLEQLASLSGPVEVNPETLRGTPIEGLSAECLVPIRGSSDGQLQGLILLGPRLSEEPYSTRDKRLLASVASQASIAMRSISLAETMAERMEAERMAEQEMQIARQVQSRLLPQQAPIMQTLDCAGKCIQTRAVGGDYFDFLEFGAGKVGLVLADISGKGMSGALLMANLQASLRGQYALALEGLPRLLRSVNTLFCRNTEVSHYATAFFSIYDEEQRTLRYVNCGHNPPLLLRTNGSVDRLEATATVLGLFEEWDCTVAELTMAAGDVLVIYTDGISEASEGEDAEEFGEDRLVANVRRHQHESAAGILDALVAEVQAFSKGEQADDMTLIVARCR